MGHQGRLQTTTEVGQELYIMRVARVVDLMLATPAGEFELLGSEHVLAAIVDGFGIKNIWCSFLLQKKKKKEKKVRNDGSKGTLKGR